MSDQMQSKYKCVYWHKKNCNWIAKVKIMHRSFHLGCFASDDDANIAVIRFKKTHGVIPDGVDSLNELQAFEYKDGLLIAKYKCQNYSIGDSIGSIDAHGYLVIGHGGKVYKAHRIIWEMLNGAIPENMNIDHINGNRLDNRIENLRLATKEVNAKNRRLSKNNTTGIHGVKMTRAKVFESTISHQGKKFYLGKFVDFFEACCARKSAEVTYGYHVNHGRSI